MSITASIWETLSHQATLMRLNPGIPDARSNFNKRSFIRNVNRQLCAPYEHYLSDSSRAARFRPVSPHWACLSYSTCIGTSQGYTPIWRPENYVNTQYYNPLSSFVFGNTFIE